MLDAAAVMTTMLTTWAAAGMPISRNARTKGLAVMSALGWTPFQGTMPIRTVIAPR